MITETSLYPHQDTIASIEYKKRLDVKVKQHQARQSNFPNPPSTQHTSIHTSLTPSQQQFKMPLWQIYHPPTAFTTEEEKAALAKDITEGTLPSPLTTPVPAPPPYSIYLTLSSLHKSASPRLLRKRALPLRPRHFILHRRRGTPFLPIRLHFPRPRLLQALHTRHDPEYRAQARDRGAAR